MYPDTYSLNYPYHQRHYLNLKQYHMLNNTRYDYYAINGVMYHMQRGEFRYWGHSNIDENFKDTPQDIHKLQVKAWDKKNLLTNYRINKMMRQNNLSDEQVIDEVGETSNFMIRLLFRPLEVDYESFVSLAKLFDCSVDYLLGNSWGETSE